MLSPSVSSSFCLISKALKTKIDTSSSFSTSLQKELCEGSLRPLPTLSPQCAQAGPREQVQHKSLQLQSRLSIHGEGWRLRCSLAKPSWTWEEDLWADTMRRADVQAGGQRAAKSQTATLALKEARACAALQPHPPAHTRCRSRPCISSQSLGPSASKTP